jgi:hypothetical protein
MVLVDMIISPFVWLCVKLDAALPPNENKISDSYRKRALIEVKVF